MKNVLILLYFLLPTFISAQEIKERRVYYLDCSLTMIGKAGGVDIYDDVISNLVSAIDAVPNKETTELIVIPFAYNTTYSNTTQLSKTYTARATTRGKATLIQNVEDLPESPRKCKGSTMTYHKDPIQDFIYHRSNNAEKIYMFLLTDGDDEEYKEHKKKTFNNEIKKWSQHFNGRKVYAFYVMLNDRFEETTDYKERYALIKEVPYFWPIKTANVNVNTICPVSVDTLDLRKEGGSVKIKFDGNIEGLNLKVKTDNQLKQTQDAKCIAKDILEVFLESNVANYDVFPSNLNKHLSVIMPNTDNEGIYVKNNTYNVLVEDGIDMPCVCQPGNNISIRNKNHSNWSFDENIIPIKTTDLLLNPDKELGTIKFFTKSVFNPKDSVIRAVNTFTFTYNKKAQELSSYAKLIFVTKDSCLNDKSFKIFANNKELIDRTISVKNPQAIECSFWMSSDVPEGEYTISLELLDNDLMFFNDKNIEDNKVVQIWTIKHRKICNPFWIWFWRLLILFALLLFVVYVVFVIRKFCAPKFPKPRVRLGFEIRPLHIPPRNIGIYHEDGNHNNNIPLCSYHRKHIRRIILQANANEVTKPKPLKKIFNWLDKKWNGETIILRANFEGRDISQIVITPIKTNEKISVFVVFSNKKPFDRIINMEWSEKDSTAIKPGKEISINDTNLIFRLYNGEKKEEIKLDSTKNFISKNIIKYYNTLTKKH